MVRVVGALTPTAILTGRVQGQGSAAFLKTETFSGEPKFGGSWDARARGALIIYVFLGTKMSNYLFLLSISHTLL